MHWATIWDWLKTPLAAGVVAAVVAAAVTHNLAKRRERTTYRRDLDLETYRRMGETLTSYHQASMQTLSGTGLTATAEANLWAAIAEQFGETIATDSKTALQLPATADAVNKCHDAMFGERKKLAKRLGLPTPVDLDRGRHRVIWEALGRMLIPPPAGEEEVGDKEDSAPAASNTGQGIGDGTCKDEEDRAPR